MNPFRNFRLRISAAWAAFIAPPPPPLSAFPLTIHADMVPALATPCQLGEAEHEIFCTTRSTKKPARARKPKATVLQTAPKPPVEDAWLRRLKEKNRLRIDNQATIERLPHNTSIASVGAYVLYRFPGETLQGFVDRCRASAGENIRIEWESDGPEKTKLDIVESALKRPLKLAEDLDFSHVLPEDLVGMQGTHRLLH